MGLPRLSWDPFDRRLHRDPYAVWKRLRDEEPVYYNAEYAFYALSRFDDVLGASLDPATFSSEHGVTLDGITDDPWASPKPMIMMDPPEHTAMRKMVNHSFFRSRVAELEERVRILCRGYLDAVLGADGFDYVRDFAMKLPVMVISSLLGFPEEDHDDLREWTDSQIHREDGTATRGESGLQDYQKLIAYYNEQIRRRREAPQGDIVSELMAAELVQPGHPDRRLDDGELLMFVALINVAGNETVARLLGWAALTLARNPDQRATLVDNPQLIGGAIEELLRYEAPSPVQGRYTTADVTCHDTVIPAGSRVALLTGSAGRDERQYRNPDVFDVQRTGIRHLSFGHGSHFCLGAALARLEARIAIEETLARFPTWDVDERAVEFVHTNSVRGPARVPMIL
ncbi:cytochrome [Mycobacterium asiaticum]|uniref:Cytochrome n=1 Tax=Mycobacterium asiaticum TaxID=1790 RepID=A0A1A3PE35_MYCAS|nr:cytochrome P450 [Mycobacterium asiaticum]OBK31564.1 cytochrome [Mycobacterium asiaticum]